MTVVLKNRIFKGPLTGCEYFNDNRALIANGPYLTLIDDTSFEEISNILALEHRVIHKIVINKNLICVFGQKAFNIIRLDENGQLVPYFERVIELEDWIFDMHWLQACQQLDNSIVFYLVIVCAHNQCALFNLNSKKIDKFSLCSQKCILSRDDLGYSKFLLKQNFMKFLNLRYSAKIIDLNKEIDVNIEEKYDNILIASGTIYNQVILWSPSNGIILVTLNGHEGVIFNIEFSYYNNFLFSTSDDRSVNTWKLDLGESLTNSNKKINTVTSGDLYTRFYGHDARVWKCCSFIDETTSIQYLCSIGEDLNCCLWNINEKVLIYRFNAMRKGSKNIWSLSFNTNKMRLLTGWCDGGLRGFELRSYLKKFEEEKMDASTTSSLSSNKEKELLDTNEWILNSENDKDFIKNVLFLSERIICCTNMGFLYLIDANSDLTSDQKGDSVQKQKLLFKSILLSNYNYMAKVKLKQDSEMTHWCLAIGTLKGFIYLLNLKLPNDKKNETIKDEITLDCINCLSIEEDLAQNSSQASTSAASLLSAGSYKISSIVWFCYRPGAQAKPRYFLLVCFGFMNGLVHLYELETSNTNQLELIARLYLPVCKHRWFTSYSIISIRTKNVSMNESNSNDSSTASTQPVEVIYLIAGDKCGNMYLYTIERMKTHEKTDEEEEYPHLALIKPCQSIKNLTKQNAAVSAIYSKNCTTTQLNDSLVDDFYFNYLIICCCKDGYYRVFEFNSDNINEFDEVDEDNQTKMGNNQTENDKNETKNSSKEPAVKEMIKLVNKYQINSYVDLIEFFTFDDDNGDYFPFLNNQNEELSSFDLENSLKLAFCFYGDKFLLWNFKLNRSLFEYKCGGAKRSWDFEFCPKIIGTSETGALFRFIYIKNKSIGEARKLLSLSEIENPISQVRNQLCQIFHGNTITVCKYLKTNEYLLTGGEDCQLILNKIDSSSNKLGLLHQFHLQGHDSVVKCIDYCELNDFEVLLVSAGGKANIKIWKCIFNENINTCKSPTINKFVQLYEFKRFINRKKSPDTSSSSKSEKPWLYIDLKSNPDIRFMDLVVLNPKEANDVIICFACSDGYVRVFRYNLENNKLFLINKYSYSKCLLCIKCVKVLRPSQTDQYDPYLLSFGTDGKLLKWKLDLVEEAQLEKIDNLHQSGINGVDIWQQAVDSSTCLVASVGDDTRISLIEFDLSSNEVKHVIKLDMAHSSAIVGVKFLNIETISTVSKDQRLVIWKIDYQSLIIRPLKVIFLNVADISSMDVFKLEENTFRFSIVGVGLEAIDVRID